MESALYKGEEIKKLLMQREPILMVDTLYSATETQAVSGLTVKAENIFCSGETLTEPGLIEHIAQSASVFVSHKVLTSTPDKEALLGYIGEVKKFKLVGSLPKVGEELRTTITVTSEVMGITLFTAETKVNDSVVVTCQMKLSV